MSFGISSFTSTRTAPNYFSTTEKSSSSLYPLLKLYQDDNSWPKPSAPLYEEIKKCGGCVRSQKILTCYTPRNSSGIVSCVFDNKEEDKILFVKDKRAATIPSGAIIDSVEFFGVDNFYTKDYFSIGLGQLNEDISFPLIVDSDSDIANERVGGYRDFPSDKNNNGKNDKYIVLTPSYVNVELQQPIVSGYIQIIIRYHMKIIT